MVGELPDEILLHIFGFIRDANTLTKLSLVNKQWNLVSNHDSLWEHIYDSQIFTKLINRFTFTESLSLKHRLMNQRLVMKNFKQQIINFRKQQAAKKQIQKEQPLLIRLLKHNQTMEHWDKVNERGAIAADGLVKRWRIYNFFAIPLISIFVLAFLIMFAVRICIGNQMSYIWVLLPLYFVCPLIIISIMFSTIIRLNALRLLKHGWGGTFMKNFKLWIGFHIVCYIVVMFSFATLGLLSVVLDKTIEHWIYTLITFMPSLVGILLATGYGAIFGYIEYKSYMCAIIVLINGLLILCSDLLLMLHFISDIFQFGFVFVPLYPIQICIIGLLSYWLLSNLHPKLGGVGSRLDCWILASSIVSVILLVLFQISISVDEIRNSRYVWCTFFMPAISVCLANTIPCYSELKRYFWWIYILHL